MPHRVLCIESDTATRQRVRRALEASGIAVEESATGLEGLARARTYPPDLVLADTRLPDIEGLEVAARLKQDRTLALVPFVAVGDQAADRDLALAAGCDGFIAQPIADEALVEEVKAYLAGKREHLPEEGERAGLKQLSVSLATRLERAVANEAGARERLAEVNRLRAAFIHDLAHELSTPLTPLAGYLKILQSDRLGPLSAGQRKVLDSMTGAVNRLTRIVDNLADFASLQAGEAAIHTAPVDPDALADEVVKDLKPAARDAHLHLELRRSAGGDPVLADGRKLRQALRNLVSNAVKFSPHGGEVLVEVSRDGGRLRFAVYDQGPGVSAPEAERIFEPFQHAEHTDDARQPGSGLGLPVARRIAEAHGGGIVVESPPHTQPSVGAHHFTGSKFVLDIPARPAVTAPEPPARVSG
jgi:signal transduction histidine kinase